LPGTSAADEKVALPALRARVASVLLPSRKVTVPLGVPGAGPAALTMAVKVTVWPNPDGLSELFTLTLVAAPETVCVNADEVLPWKLLSPL
jgi:hypothetical protein